MPRPKTGRTGQNVTLYLESRILKAAKKHAFKLSTSLSDVVNRLLVAELDSKGGIAARHPHPRQLPMQTRG